MSRGRVGVAGATTAVVGLLTWWLLAPVPVWAVAVVRADGVLGSPSALIVLLATGWLTGWWAWTLVEIARCLGGSRVPRSRLSRLLVGVAVGSALAGGAPGTSLATVTSPPDQHRDQSSGVAGLRLPDRVPGGIATAPPEQRRHVVRAGDTLWEVAADRLPRPSPVAVDRAWRLLYRANRAVVGDDPDLLHPGTVLEVPRSATHSTGAAR